jgi:hypothetical protein
MWQAAIPGGGEHTASASVARARSGCRKVAGGGAGRDSSGRRGFRRRADRRQSMCRAGVRGPRCCAGDSISVLAPRSVGVVGTRTGERAGAGAGAWRLAAPVRDRGVESAPGHLGLVEANGSSGRAPKARHIGEARGGSLRQRPQHRRLERRRNLRAQACRRHQLAGRDRLAHGLWGSVAVEGGGWPGQGTRRPTTPARIDRRAHSAFGAGQSARAPCSGWCQQRARGR